MAGAEIAVGVFVIILISIILLAFATLALMIWSILDIVGAKNKGDWKVIWILIVALLGLIGIIIYLVVGRRDRKK